MAGDGLESELKHGVPLTVAPGVTVTFGSEETRTRARLHDSIGTGEILRCVYFAGSRAGAERPIVPISIDGRKVRARCLDSGRTKTYKLELMRILEEGDEGVDLPAPHLAEPEPQRASPVRSIEEVVARHAEDLEALGWALALSHDALELRRGEEQVAALILARTADGSWTVRGDGLRALSRPTLKGANSQFLKRARELANTPRTETPRVPRRIPWLLVLAGSGAFLLGILLGLVV